MKSILSLFVIVAVGLSGCVDIPDFGDAPEITGNSVSQFTEYDSLGKKDIETVVITLDFQDGDGDLGTDPSDPNLENWGNYELVTSTLQADNTWSEGILSEDVRIVFPDLKPGGKPGPIKGKLYFNIRYFYSGNAVMMTKRYKVKIRDRALNESAQITTDTVIVPAFEN
jgi:hypothetical protein